MVHRIFGIPEILRFLVTLMRLEISDFACWKRTEKLKYGFRISHTYKIRIKLEDFSNTVKIQRDKVAEKN